MPDNEAYPNEFKLQELHHLIIFDNSKECGDNIGCRVAQVIELFQPGVGIINVACYTVLNNLLS